MKKYLFTLMASLICSVSGLFAEIYYGTCGDSLQWSLDTETGVLSITGSGDMTDFSYESRAPWHNYQSVITSCEIGDSVSSIGEYAFYEYLNLSSITIPNSVTSIGAWSFAKCSGFMSISIPTSVTSIGYAAFSCVNNIVYNGSLYRSWGERCRNGYIEGNLIYSDSSKKKLCGCNVNATSIFIPSTVTTIGIYAFYNCTELTSISIPNSVTDYQGYTFFNCSRLETVNIPTSFTSIENFTFCGCTSLKTINIPTSVTTIGSAAFQGCSSLATVNIPTSVTVIGYAAFQGCSSLATVNIPTTVESISAYAFDGVNNILYSGSATGAPWGAKYYNCYIEGDLIFSDNLKSELCGCSTSAISATIPNTVTSIRSNAFEACTGLINIEIPSSVTSIGEYAFKDCTSQTRVHLRCCIPPTLQSTSFNSTEVQVFIPVGTSEAYKSDAIWNAIAGLSEEYKIDLSVNYPLCSAEYSAICDSSKIVLSATPADGYRFIKWSDGNTQNPRTFTLCKDTAFMAVFEKNDRGTCGQHLTWIYEDHVLTINGTGAMNNYVQNSVPWNAYIDSITAIEFNTGITHIGNYAFSDCSNLTSISIPNSVTQIGYNAFSGCGNLVALFIPESVERIGESAFVNCNMLTNITINSNLILGKNYNSTYNLTSLFGLQVMSCYIGDSVTSIGDYAFYNNPNLQSVSIGNSVNTIGTYAFYGCTDIVSVNIPNSVTSIGNYAFLGCSALKAVHISDLKNWCSVQFSNSSANPLYYAHDLYLKGHLLKNLVIPNTITTISQYAFYNCDSLSSLTIPNSVTSIDASAFSGCSGVTSVTWNAYHYTASSAYNSSPFYVICSHISSFSFGDSVRSIPAYLCYDMSNLRSITMPDSIISIGAGAFYGCTRLSSVNIPNSVKSIGNNAFRYCSGLNYVTIPNSVTYIGSEAFYNCYGLKSITIPSSVTYIGNDALHNVKNVVYGGTATGSPWGATSFFAAEDSIFYYSNVTKTAIVKVKNTNIISITIPYSVTSIDESAFSGCSGLSSITWKACNYPSPSTASKSPLYNIRSQITSFSFGDSVRTIPAYLFYQMQNITSMIIPQSVLSIGAGAFYGCYGMTTIVVESGNPVFDSRDNCNAIVKTATNALIIGCKNSIVPNSITTIGSNAFYGCSQITNIDIPNSVTSIGSNAFRDCTGLISIIIPNSVISLGSSAFYNCSALTSVTIGTSVSSIGANAFYGCTNHAFNNLILSHVKTISTSAFEGCNYLTSVVFGDQLEKVGDGAFKNCTRINEITCYATTTPEVVASTFEGVSSKAYLYVKAGSKHTYEVDANWGRFDIRELGTSYTQGDANGDLEVDVQDVSATVEYILGHNPEPFDVTLADVDQDGVVDVCDVAQMVNIILYGTPERPSANQLRAYLASSPSLTADGITIIPSVDTQLTVMLKDEGHSFTALQMDAELPEGISLEAVYVGNRARRHSLVSEQLPDGSYRIILYSLGNAAFVNDGDCLLQFQLTADASYQQPEATLRLTSVTAATASGRKMQLGDAEAELICPVTSALEQTGADGNAPQKYVKDGILYIRCGDHLYDSTGRLAE